MHYSKIIIACVQIVYQSIATVLVGIRVYIKLLNQIYEKTDQNKLFQMQLELTLFVFNKFVSE